MHKFRFLSIYYQSYNIMKMQPNPSIIDMLRNLHQQQSQQQAQQGPRYLPHLPKCDSLQLDLVPIQKPLSLTHPAPASGLATQRKHPHQENKKSLFINASTKLNHNTLIGPPAHHIKQVSRNDQLLFQIKLKLASFVARFNIDNLCLVNVREQSVESMLDLVFKKFKQFKKDHETMMKACNESIKFKQIEILNLQSKLSNLEEILCQQTNKFSRTKQKQSQQQSNLHQHIQSLQCQLQNSQKSIFMLEQITKQQNGFIKHLQSEQSEQFSTKLLTLESQISTMNSKYHVVCIENKELKDEMHRVCEENRKINEEILEVMEQNKEYKMEIMKSKEKMEKISDEFQAVQEKLIAYYEMYMAEVKNKQEAEFSLKALQKQMENLKNQNQEQSESIKQVAQKTLLQKQALLIQNLALKKQLEWFKKDNQLKQTQILKLSKTMSQLVHSINSRHAPSSKKARSEMQIPSQHSQSEDRDKYSIKINGMEGWSLKKNKEKSMEKERQRQKERLKQLQKMERQNQEKIRKIIEDWKLRLDQTVDYYEKYIQNLQSKKSQK